MFAHRTLFGEITLEKNNQQHPMHVTKQSFIQMKLRVVVVHKTLLIFIVRKCILNLNKVQEAIVDNFFVLC